MSDYSTMIIQPTLINPSRNWLLDNDWVTLIIRQLAWLIIRLWLSHIDYSWLINQLITLIIYSSSQASSINQLEWLIIRVIDYSTMIRQWLFNQPARVIDYSTRLKSHWLFASSRDWWFDNDWGTLIIRQLAWLIIWQRLSHIDYSFLLVIRAQSTNHVLV